MIAIKNGILAMSGSRTEILAECTCILSEVYEKLVDDFGPEKANEIFADVGRMAVDATEK